MSRDTSITTEEVSTAHGPAPEPAHLGHHQGDGWGLIILQAATLALAVGLLVLGRSEAGFIELSKGFVSIVLEALPFVLLGALVSGLIEVFVPREKVAAFLPAKSSASVFLAGLLGIVFPVCECAIVPVVRRLVKKGVPLSAAVAYLLAGPIVNPIVAASTGVAYAFHPDVVSIVAIRMIAGYVIAVGVGSLMGEFFTARSGLIAAAQHDSHASCDHYHGHEHAASLWGRLRRVLTHATEDFFDVGRFLILGAFFAGLMQSLIDRDALVVLMSSPSLSIGLMMALAVALNLCSEADAFVAASFRGTLPLAAQMAFMVLGPMLDIKLLMMYLGLFRRRMIVALATAVVAFVFITMYTMHVFSRGAM